MNKLASAISTLAQREPPSFYKTINDAEVTNPGLAPGSTQIWYIKDEYFRDAMVIFRDKESISIDELEKTHVLLGSVDETDPEEIWVAMQGEHWSPNGEARNLISSKGLSHTSMSVGDVIVLGHDVFVTAFSGFDTIRLVGSNLGKRLAQVDMIPYTNSLKITNLEALGRGTGAKYLLAIRGEDGAFVAKQWKRNPPNKLRSGEVLIDMGGSKKEARISIIRMLKDFGVLDTFMEASENLVDKSRMPTYNELVDMYTEMLGGILKDLEKEYNTEISEDEYLSAVGDLAQTAFERLNKSWGESLEQYKKWPKGKAVKAQGGKKYDPRFDALIWFVDLYHQTEDDPVGWAFSVADDESHPEQFGFKTAQEAFTALEDWWVKHPSYGHLDVYVYDSQGIRCIDTFEETPQDLSPEKFYSNSKFNFGPGINFYEMGVPRSKLVQLLRSINPSGQYRITDDTVFFENQNDAGKLQELLLSASAKIREEAGIVDDLPLRPRSMADLVIEEAYQGKEISDQTKDQLIESLANKAEELYEKDRFRSLIKKGKDPRDLLYGLMQNWLTDETKQLYASAALDNKETGRGVSVWFHGAFIFEMNENDIDGRKAKGAGARFVTVEPNGDISFWCSYIKIPMRLRNQVIPIDEYITTLGKDPTKKGAAMKKSSGVGTEIEGVDEDNNTINYIGDYGPGKFNDNVSEYVYDIVMNGFSNQSLGESDGFGSYDLVIIDPPMTVNQEGGGLGGQGQWLLGAAIMHEDSQGFIDVATFDNGDEALEAWAELEKEYEQFLGEVEEENPGIEV